MPERSPTTTISRPSTPNALDTTDELSLHALRAADLLDSKKATDVVALNVRDLTPLHDFMIVASGNSYVQINALADEVQRELELLGYVRRNPRSNRGEDPWVVLDFGFLVVHLFRTETRAYYNLEKLWYQAEVIYRSRADQSSGTTQVLH